MTSEAAIIFPHQLFASHPVLRRGRPVWLVEDSLFFGNDPHQPMNFHRHKLVMHRASMKAYEKQLRTEGHDVHYVDAGEGQAIDQRLPSLLPRTMTDLWVADPVDYLLERRLRRYARRQGVILHVLETPMFLTPPEWFQPWFEGRKRYFMADFYAAQRKRLNLLVDASGKPEGGRWSFDAENRRRWPAARKPPPVYQPGSSSLLVEAAGYVGKFFPGRPGPHTALPYPVTHNQARDSFHHFLEHRLIGFGDYEDAISSSEPWLHHAVLTPALNIGLITPREVVDDTLAFATERSVPLNDLEGFLRQVVGWREFMRIVYVREGVRQRTGNFWNHRRHLDHRWYEGSTGLDPLDHVIRRVMASAYAHHIERLMVVGNAMLLTERHPDHAYRWFMELFIDAYDWVMVPNVYGMSLFADGGLITTKPYFSGSNYLRKMSDFPTGPWCDTWDGLYWRFVARHRDFFEGQPRLSMMTRTLDRMAPARRALLEAAADRHLEA